MFPNEFATEIDKSAIEIPTRPVISECRTLSRTVAAIDLVIDGEGQARLGGIHQLQAGLRVGVCGRGYNERTIKVTCGDSFYFVFRDDLNAAPI